MWLLLWHIVGFCCLHRVPVACCLLLPIVAPNLYVVLCCVVLYMCSSLCCLFAKVFFKEFSYKHKILVTRLPFSFSSWEKGQLEGRTYHVVCRVSGPYAQYVHTSIKYKFYECKRAVCASVLESVNRAVRLFGFNSLQSVAFLFGFRL